MNFTDIKFCLFFVVVITTYYVLPTYVLQRSLLIVASLFFYAFESPVLVILLLTSCALTVATSHIVIVSNDNLIRRLATVTGVSLNLIILGFFKYKGLLSPVMYVGATPGLLRDLLLLPLPIGISFYTFHGISLLVDCFRKRDAFFRNYKSRLSSHWSDSLLYLVFFPQLIAGPIVKAKELFPQLSRKKFSGIQWNPAIKALVFGYFLKMFVADNLQEATIFMRAPYFEGLSTFTLLALLVGYSFQIFADFAGYSLIAIGLGILLGYKLPENFRFPYVADSFSDFWRRWHISLSSWLRDYLYIPLGGSRHGGIRTYLNLIIVMLLGGLWHGAAWNFAVWGLWHGLALAFERPFHGTSFMRSRVPFVLGIRIFIVFSVVSVGWLLFRLSSMSEAWSYLSAVASNHDLPIKISIIGPLIVFGLPVIICHAIYLLKPRLTRLAYSFIFAAMLFLTVFNSGRSTAFVYFQF